MFSQNPFKKKYIGDKQVMNKIINIYQKFSKDNINEIKEIKEDMKVAKSLLVEDYYKTIK